MATTKVTFTLDQATVSRISHAAEVLAKPKSEVVRDAIADYHDRLGRRSQAETDKLLAAFDELVPLIPKRPASHADREIAEVRRARRTGGRRSR